MPSATPNSVAVVTGASAGLGRALAYRLSASGVHVVGLARNEQALMETDSNCPSKTFHPIKFDVANFSDVQRAAEEIQDTVGAVQILINNAAILERCELVSPYADRINDQIQTNLLGPLNCVRAFLPQMPSSR